MSPLTASEAGLACRAVEREVDRLEKVRAEHLISKELSSFDALTGHIAEAMSAYRKLGGFDPHYLPRASNDRRHL